MCLYVRTQVEAFAIRKWGSLDALDQEFTRRQAEKEVRKKAVFKKKNLELRQKTVGKRLTLSSLAKESLGHVHSFGPVVAADLPGWCVILFLISREQQTCSSCGLIKKFESL